MSNILADTILTSGTTEQVLRKYNPNLKSKVLPQTARNVEVRPEMTCGQRTLQGKGSVQDRNNLLKEPGSPAEPQWAVRNAVGEVRDGGEQEGCLVGLKKSKEVAWPQLKRQKGPKKGLSNMDVI